MVRAILISLLFFYSVTDAIAITTSADSINHVDSKGLKQGKWVKIEDGKKRYEGQFKDNKPFGKFTYFHTNGKVKAVTDYSSDGRIARTNLFDLEGELEAQGKYVDQKKDSIWAFYFKGGKKISSTESWKIGKKDGPMKTFFIDGKVATECNFLNDIPDGLCKEYFTSGTIKKEYTFKDGLLDGFFKTYFMNQLPDISGRYEKALKVGEWVEYNDNGKIKTRRTFKAGNLIKEQKVNGNFTEYFPNGIPMLEVQYKEGKKDGPFKEYYDAGVWKRVPKPASEEDGNGPDYMEVLEGTKLKVEGNYLNDKYDGKVTTYDEKGKVMKVENYKEGILLK